MSLSGWPGSVIRTRHGVGGQGDGAPASYNAAGWPIAGLADDRRGRVAVVTQIDSGGGLSMAESMVGHPEVVNSFRKDYENFSWPGFSDRAVYVRQMQPVQAARLSIGGWKRRRQ